MVFSVSIGDRIATLTLLHDILRSLEKSHGAAAQYRAVKAWLDSLESALKFLVDIDCQNEALAEALEEATAQFKASISEFLKKIGKYQPSLNAGGSGNRCKDTLRKIQWQLSNKDDVQDFQGKILCHATAIQMILDRVRM